jgi:hypothetical protein
MQTEVQYYKVNLYAATRKNIVICKRVADALLKWFTQVVDTLIKVFIPLVI